MEALPYIATIGTVIAGALYWFWYRTPRVEEPPLVIKPPTNFSTPSSKKTIKKKDGIPIKILYYSQTGTAEDFAHRLGEDISAYGFAPDVSDVENFSMDELENEKLVVFLAATYGEGDPPDNAAEFHRDLMNPSKEAGLFSNIKYAVFGLGNKTYDKFNQMGKDVDRRMTELGAQRIFDMGLGDDDVNIEKDFLSWKKGFAITVCKEFGLAAPSLTTSATISVRRQRMVTHGQNEIKNIPVDVIARWRPSEKPKFAPDQKFPYLATILETRELHSTISERSCLHSEISTHGDILTYQPGDHLGIYPENDLTMVHKLAAQLKADLKTIISIYGIEDVAGKNPIVGPCTLKAALTQYYDIASVVRKPLLKVLGQYAKDEEEKKKLATLASEEPEHQEYYEKYIVHDCRCITEVLKDFKSLEVKLDHFLEVLPKMQPRYYSISSSPNTNPGRVTLTAVVVDYITPTKREAKGVATTWLSHNRPNPEKPVQIPAFIRKSQFKLPTSTLTPIIMVGPGTGFAPFRGFIQERAYRLEQGDKLGQAILFFGCRHPEKDYLYREELENHLKQGHISDLIVAFSRETESKIYVQHKMKEADFPKRIWDILSNAGHFYVCGDAPGMARDVSDTLIDIIMTEGNRSKEEAMQFIEDLQKNNRHQSDVWS
jgi:NADPH-ferrihemoprotein reductase